MRIGAQRYTCGLSKFEVFEEIPTDAACLEKTDDYDAIASLVHGAHGFLRGEIFLKFYDLTAKFEPFFIFLPNTH